MPKLKAVVCPGVPEAERERLNGEGGCVYGRGGGGPAEEESEGGGEESDDEELTWQSSVNPLTMWCASLWAPLRARRGLR